MNEPEPIAPELPVYFDDVGRPVPVDHPEVYNPEPDTELREALREGIGNFLERLAAVGDANATGQVVLVMAFLAGKTRHQTKAQLAKSMGVSAGRISQILRGIPPEFQSLTPLRNRSKSESAL